jgi:hypothetical protein
MFQPILRQAIPLRFTLGRFAIRSGAPLPPELAGFKYVRRISMRVLFWS